MKLTPRAHATYCMFNFLAEDAYEKYRTWFNEHPDEAFCLWTKEGPEPEKAKYEPDFLVNREYIDNIDDLSIVQFRGDIFVFTKFCPKVIDGVRELYLSGRCSNTILGYHWDLIIDPNDKDNFEFTIKKVSE